MATLMSIKRNMLGKEAEREEAAPELQEAGNVG